MKIASLFLLLLIFSGCANQIPLGKSVVDKYDMTSDDLSNIQFYMAKDLVLYRSATSKTEKATEKGTLTVKDGKFTDQVVIKAGTPGTLIKSLPGNKLAVGFEADDERFLVFGPSGHGDRFTLQAAQWNGTVGIVQYGNGQYRTGPKASDVYLKFKMKHLKQVQRNQTIVKGRKLNK